MDITANIKRLREQHGLIQKQVAAELGIGYSNYNKMENGQREPSVEELKKLARLFNITVDALLNPEDTTPVEVVIEDKSVSEKVRMIDQLDDDDKHVLYRMIEAMLTKKKFLDFYQKNIAAI
jgi:transcriptional regulator with XRE-family HTH domain